MPYVTTCNIIYVYAYNLRPLKYAARHWAKINGCNTTAKPKISFRNGTAGNMTVQHTPPVFRYLEGPADSMTKSAALHQCPLEPVARHFICADVRKYNDVTGLPHV